MEKELLYRVCPACGMLMPYIQTRCDCGYHFTQHKKLRPSHLAAAAALSAVVFFFAGYGFSQFQGEQAASVSTGTQVVESGAAKSKTTEQNAASVQKQDQARPVEGGTENRRSFSDLQKDGASEVSVKNGEILRKPAAELIAPLDIEAGNGGNCYVLLHCTGYAIPSGYAYDEIGCRRNDMSFYVARGETASVDVPIGSYEIYYATGEAWQGELRLFGDDTRYYKCDELFTFYVDGDYAEGYSLTLYDVPNGNMDTDIIGKADFPTIGEAT